MVESDSDKCASDKAAIEAAQFESLPYFVELWKSGQDVERVLGRASSAALAQAIFKAALTELPGRRITLRRGEEIIEQSRG
jgi:hypothetical protein